MKYIDAYRAKLNCQKPDEVFSYLVSSMKPTIKGWDYFVNWQKVIDNYSAIEPELNLLNSLIGKSDVLFEAEKLITKYPEIIKVIPVLLACREARLNLLVDYKNGFIYKDFAFEKILEAKKAAEFMQLSGILKLFENKTIKSVPDYVLGVEAGLDSNGRKNRSGTSMEGIVEFFVEDVCNKNRWDFISQATQKKIENKWKKSITIEKSSRQIDFAILANKNLFLIETNFYGGGGSKLKSTAGEYKSDFRRWKADGHQFIWITDGEGWIETRKPLRETFDDTDTILNLSMLEKGLLEDCIKHA